MFELTDAALLTRNPESLAELSLAPIFRRQWHSSYEALEDCNPSRDKMMAIYTWLAWCGEQIPSLIEVVRLYLRRFTIEHWYRFAFATITLDFT